MTNKKEEFNLITIYGDEIIIETDEDSLDKVFEVIIEALDINELYSVGNYGETATFKGHDLTIIDFKKIIGRD